MCGSMVDNQSLTTERRRGKKIEREKPQGKNIMSASAMQAGHNKLAPFYGPRCTTMMLLVTVRFC